MKTFQNDFSFLLDGKSFNRINSRGWGSKTRMAQYMSIIRCQFLKTHNLPIAIKYNIIFQYFYSLWGPSAHILNMAEMFNLAL